MLLQDVPFERNGSLPGDISQKAVFQALDDWQIRKALSQDVEYAMFARGCEWFGQNISWLLKMNHRECREVWSKKRMAFSRLFGMH